MRDIDGGPGNLGGARWPLWEDTGGGSACLYELSIPCGCVLCANRDLGSPSHEGRAISRHGT